MGVTSLPVFTARPTAGPADLVRLYHRAQLQSARAIAEETVLDGGTWLRNSDLQPLPDANCVIDAAMQPQGSAGDLAAEFERVSADCPIQGWTINPSLPAERTQPLVDHLKATGWKPNPRVVLHLRQLRAGADPASVAGLTVIPARAGFGPLRRLMDDRFGDVRAEASLLAYDDAHLDGWLALRHGAPIAIASLLNDGEVGTVTDLYVVPSERGRGVGRLMLARVLEASARSGHRHALVGAPPGSTLIFESVGFEPVGEWVRLERRR